MKKSKRNAVLYKDMTVDMKKPKILLIMLLTNCLLLPIVAGFFIALYVCGINGTLGYRFLANYFIALVFTEATILLFIIPAITAGSISLEKERQTLEVLLTTRLTPWEIIKGKFFSNYILIALLVLSTIPMLSLVFIYGGIAFWQMLYVYLVLFVYIALISSFGVFFSSLTKNTVSAVVLTYMFTLAFILLTAALPWIFIIAIELINELLYYDSKISNFVTDEHLIPSDYFLMLGIGNPFYTLFDVIGHSITYSLNGVKIEGMNSCGSFLPHTSEKNILFRLWTPISIVVQLVTTYILLRISAVLLNPVKGKKKKKHLRK